MKVVRRVAALVKLQSREGSSITKMVVEARIRAMIPNRSGTEDFWVGHRGWLALCYLWKSVNTELLRRTHSGPLLICVLEMCPSQDWFSLGETSARMIFSLSLRSFRVELIRKKQREHFVREKNSALWKSRFRGRWRSLIPASRIKSI